MTQSNPKGCPTWLVVLGLLFVAISQCGKDDAPNTIPLAAADLAPVPASRALYVQPQILNCRAGPTAGSLALRALRSGDLVQIRREDHGWALVDGHAASWVKSSYLAETPSTQASASSAPEKPRRGPSLSKARREMIKASIAAYPGPCACPYNAARNGSRCGGRSAYSRRGGYAPVCYPGDITEEDAIAWLERQLSSSNADLHGSLFLALGPAHMTSSSSGESLPSGS